MRPSYGRRGRCDAQGLQTTYFGFLFDSLSAVCCSRFTIQSQHTGARSRVELRWEEDEVREISIPPVRAALIVEAAPPGCGRVILGSVGDERDEVIYFSCIARVEMVWLTDEDDDRNSDPCILGRYASFLQRWCIV